MSIWRRWATLLEFQVLSLWHEGGEVPIQLMQIYLREFSLCIMLMLKSEIVELITIDDGCVKR